MDGSIGVVASAVGRWAGGALPGDESAADAAVDTALDALARGDSVAEACDAAQRLVRSWTAHPARRDPGRNRLPAAS